LSSSFQRLNHLRLVTGKTWQEVATDLGLSRSMLFRVKSGSRNLSEKAIFRLAQAEVAAGIHGEARALIEAGNSPEHIVAAMVDQTRAAQPKLTLEDFDRGEAEVQVCYRRGSPPPGYPASVRVRAAANEDVLRLGLSIDARAHRRQPGPLLSLCLTGEHAQPDFLNLLTPRSYRDVVEVCIGLTFGATMEQQEPAA
jgi:transcriptional regulator with XRE-family HTH domain